jgi:hypothetical protein
MENEEEMKEVKEEMKVKEQIAKIEKEIDTIQAIFEKYSSQRWDSLRHTSSFREQVEPEFHKFDPYSFDELKQEKSKLLDKENLLLQKSLQGITPFHFSQLMIFKILTFKYSYEFMFCHVQQFQVHQQVKYI